MNYILKNEFCEATFSSRGAEMISFKSADGRDILWQNKTGKGWLDHAPILFPLCGNIKDKKAIYKGVEYPLMQHGFALRSEFEMLEKSDDKIVFRLASSEATKAQYPFDFILTVTYELCDNLVKLSATVENTGDDILPYSFGWHPGFSLPCEDGQDIEDYAIKLDNKTELTWVHFYNDFDKANDYLPYPIKNSEYKLCEKEIYENDTMVFHGAGQSAVLTADGSPFSLTVTWTENIPVLCLWKSANHDYKFICIEPWTHDTIRGERSNLWEEREAHRLNPGEKEDFVYTVSFKF